MDSATAAIFFLVHSILNLLSQEGRRCPPPLSNGGLIWRKNHVRGEIDVWQQLTTSGLESEQHPLPHTQTLLIPFKHTLKILIVNGGVGGRRGSSRGQNYLELRLGMGVCCMTQWTYLCVKLCCRQLDQLSLEPPGAQGSGFQCEETNWLSLEGVPRSSVTLGDEEQQKWPHYGKGIMSHACLCHAQRPAWSPQVLWLRLCLPAPPMGERTLESL